MAVRPQPGRHARSTLESASNLSSLPRLVDALRKEKTRFIVVGMTAAVLQGAPVTTFDVDLWIDLPPRQSMRMINLARDLGAEMIANTIVVFPGDLTVNFIYKVTGLASFASEIKQVRRLNWMGRLSIRAAARTHLCQQEGRRPPQRHRPPSFT